jgi:prepilin-type N-terminal cleavage/methylation domain-containing protein
MGMKTERQGYTLIQLLIAIALIGVIALVVSPEIINSMEVRGLENSVRDMMITMERAKFLAIKSKLNHRVRFDNSMGPWILLVEQETASGVWERIPGLVEKSIPDKFNLTLNLPSADPTVVFSPMGLVLNYDQTNHNVVLQSDRLRRHEQPDQREVVFYFGGSLKLVKSSSG